MTSEAVPPACTLTTWRAEAMGVCRTTSWSPGRRSVMVTGATPRSVPSTRTLAPAGCDSTRRLPVSGVFANSRYCETSAPAVTLSGMTRGTPRPRSSRMCAPAGTENRAGVCPRSTPSTNTCTPGGFDCTTSVPVDGVATRRPVDVAGGKDAAAGDDDERGRREDGLSARSAASVVFFAAFGAVAACASARNAENGAASAIPNGASSATLNGASGLKSDCAASEGRASLSDRWRQSAR